MRLSKKLCECGCGEFTNIAPETRPRSGWVKGRAMRFKNGHRTYTGKSYKARIVNGRVKYTHRLRAEQALGHALPVYAVVHHIDGSKNPNSSLVICQDTEYHLLLHTRAKVVVAGGNPNTQRICSMCKELISIEQMVVKKNYCKNCYARYAKEYRRKRNGQKG